MGKRVAWLGYASWLEAQMRWFANSKWFARDFGQLGYGLIETPRTGWLTGTAVYLGRVHLAMSNHPDQGPGSPELDLLLQSRNPMQHTNPTRLLPRLEPG
jgi:hypothetical protein